MTLHARVRYTLTNVGSRQEDRRSNAVYTDCPVKALAGLYLRAGDPIPPDGVEIRYGDWHASWVVDGKEVRARMVEEPFDVEAETLT